MDATRSRATVVNAGSIGGNAASGTGVYLQFGGTITNQTGGAISGGTDAVTFAAGHTNRLVIDPGATFTGTVDGGNTIGAASISTLELASGASAGTLSGLGTQYIDFAQVTIDAGAAWMLSGTADRLRHADQRRQRHRRRHPRCRQLHRQQPVERHDHRGDRP